MKDLPFSKSKFARRNVMDAQEFKSIISNERVLQRQIEEYLDIQHIDYIRIPDAVYRILFGKQSRLTVKDKSIIARYITGLKDLTILKPFNDEYALAWVVELKTKKGKMSQGQKNKHRNLPTRIIRSFEDFERQLKIFLNFRNGKEKGRGVNSSIFLSVVEALMDMVDQHCKYEGILSDDGLSANESAFSTLEDLGYLKEKAGKKYLDWEYKYFEGK